MATLEENLKNWNDIYTWPSAGDEWSAQFGGTEALWFFVLYPRLHRFIPAPAILEIAPGFGRWTQFLRTQCHSLIAVDISPKCIEYCETRFASDTHMKFHVNDGISLELINWNTGNSLIDAISVFTRPNSRWDRGDSSMENGEFLQSAGLTSRLAKVYCS